MSEQQSNDSSTVSRRGFLKTGATAAAGAMAMSARSYAQVAGANNKLRLGLIGCGSMAGTHLGALIHMRESENVDIVATCDVYKKRAEEYAARVADKAPKPDVVQDYRRVLERKDIDYVVIAIPEHSHAYVTMAALEAGKHVYCEKPMTHIVEDSQKVLQKVKDTKLKMQVGVQSMADDSYISARQAILAGKIGTVVEAHVDYVRSYKERGPWREKNLVGDTKPGDLDWGAWLGPAQKVAWNQHHYGEWRCYREYSGGIAADLFIHRTTRILKACNLTFPSHVCGMGGIYTWGKDQGDDRDLPDSFDLLAEYPAVQGITNGMTMYCLGTMANDDGISHCIRGTKSTLWFTDTGWEIKHGRNGVAIESHKKTGGEDVTPHHKNHHDAIRNGAELNCPAELGLYAVALVCMSNQSWFEKKMKSWDTAKNCIV